MARRAAVRRARRAHSPAAHEAILETLVFDPDAAARDRLRGLLAGFGFLLYCLPDISEARVIDSHGVPLPEDPRHD